MNQLFDLYSLP